MSYVKIWIHAVWTTKNREPVLSTELRQQIFHHIKDNGLKKDIYIDTVNGHNNHVHCLFRLKNDQTIMKCIQLLKGESSFWVTQQKLLPVKLVWQKEYFAVSVSESIVERVRQYITNQESHHKKVTWDDEYAEFVKKYGFNMY